MSNTDDGNFVVFWQYCSKLLLSGYIRKFDTEFKWNTPGDIRLLCFTFFGSVSMNFNYITMHKYLHRKYGFPRTALPPLHLYIALNIYTDDALEVKLKSIMKFENWHKQIRTLSPNLEKQLNSDEQHKFIYYLYTYLCLGSLDILGDNNKWQSVGFGTLELIKNKYNPTKVLIKLIPQKSKQIHIFQCKPRHKFGCRSQRKTENIIIKGRETINNTEAVLCIRFHRKKMIDKWHKQLTEIETQILKILKLGTNGRAPRVHRNWAIMTGRSWKCNLCMHYSNSDSSDCDVCFSPKT